MSKRQRIHQRILTMVMWAVTGLFTAPFYILIVYAFKPREATMLKSPLALSLIHI